MQPRTPGNGSSKQATLSDDLMPLPEAPRWYKRLGDWCVGFKGIVSALGVIIAVIVAIYAALSNVATKPWATEQFKAQASETKRIEQEGIARDRATADGLLRMESKLDVAIDLLRQR